MLDSGESVLLLVVNLVILVNLVKLVILANLSNLVILEYSGDKLTWLISLEDAFTLQALGQTSLVTVNSRPPGFSFYDPFQLYLSYISGIFERRLVYISSLFQLHF